MAKNQAGKGLTRRALVGLAATAPIAAATDVHAAPRTLRGIVVYRERIALSPDAVVEVKLLDVSLADAPSRTIAEARIRGRRGSPIRYVLRFDSAAIEPRRRYALQARITSGEQLLFINTTQHAVFTGGLNPTTIRVERVAGATSGQAPAGGGPVGRWLAEDIRGGGVIDRLQTVLDISADGRVSGSGGCNRIMGRATISGPSISFGAIGSTRMACVPAAMDQEQKFLAALAEVRGWRVDAARRKLYLLGSSGAALVTLAQM